MTRDTEYQWSDGRWAGLLRTMLGVPLLRNGVVIGVIAIHRRTPRPFSARQIELVTTFADQAVIAINNVGLIEEVQARTRELQETLEYQTAASDVLNVISRAPSDIQPVFDVIVQTAGRLCHADSAIVLTLRDDGKYHLAATYGYSREFQRLLELEPIEAERGTVSGRAVLERETVYVPDVLADPEYGFNEGQKLGGFRAALGVPLLRQGHPIGVITLTHPTLRTFTAKQIELVETFADQAVIAIENARLFEEAQKRTAELSESLEYQTATSEVLNVISRAPSQLQPVFEAIVETAGRLCDVRDVNNLTIENGGTMHVLSG